MRATDPVTQYAEQGYLCPLPAIGAEKAQALRAQLEAFERGSGATLGKLPGQLRAKTHLLFPWLADLVRDGAVLKHVVPLLGPNLLVYHVTCWLKEPGDESFVSWHQDGTYFYLNPPQHVTAWVALSDSTPESGCVEVVPGSHRLGQRPHASNPDAANLLSNGQSIEAEINSEAAVPLALRAGEMSLHDTHLVHSSGRNRSGDRRIGIGISYIPTHVRYRGQQRVSATLVCGQDAHEHFDPEPRPAAVMDAAARAFHAEACARFFDSHGSARSGAIPRAEGAPATGEASARASGRPAPG